VTQGYILIESSGILKEKSTIAGILAIPRESRNKKFYPPQELAKNHGKTIKIDLDHKHARTIGEAKIFWDEEMTQLTYVGTINDKEVEKELKKGIKFHTSIEASYDSSQECPWDHECEIPQGLNITRMALTLQPGMPETTARIVESTTAEVDKTFEPFADFKDFDDCVKKNQDKDDPEAFCGKIKAQTEKRKCLVCKESISTSKWIEHISSHPGSFLISNNSSFLENTRSRSQMTDDKTKPKVKELKITEPSCPEGTSFDVDSGKCIQDKSEEQEDCPEGQTWNADAGKCMPESEEKDCGCEKEKHATRIASVLKKAPTTKPSDITRDKIANEYITDIINKVLDTRDKNLPSGDYTNKNIDEEQNRMNPIIEKLNELGKKITDVSPKPKLESKITVETLGTKLQETYGGVAQWFGDSRTSKFGNYIWDINKTKWLESQGYKTAKETITATNVPALTFQRRIILDPGGISRTPVRQYTNFQEVAQGTNTVNFYSGNTGATGFAAITVGTAITDVAATVTRTQAVPAHTGMMISVGFPDIHDIPGDVVSYVNDVMALRAIEDEATEVLTTTWGTYAATNWVDGAGGPITTDDIATNVLTRDGVTNGRKLIGIDGWPTIPGSQVLYLHPTAFEELMTDTNLNNFYQFARPEITANMVLEQLYGVQLEISNQVPLNSNTTFDNYRNPMFTKGVSTGLASSQNLEMEADRRNELSQILITGRHRIRGARALETSHCRISTGD